MSGVAVTYKLTRCGRCKVQLEPAPFATELGENDWGHPVEGQECWENTGAVYPLGAAERLFPVEHVKLQYDGHTYREVDE